MSKKKVVKSILGIVILALGCVTVTGVVIAKTALDSLKNIDLSGEDW